MFDLNAYIEKALADNEAELLRAASIGGNDQDCAYYRITKGTLLALKKAASADNAPTHRRKSRPVKSRK